MGLLLSRKSQSHLQRDHLQTPPLFGFSSGESQSPSQTLPSPITSCCSPIFWFVKFSHRRSIFGGLFRFPIISGGGFAAPLVVALAKFFTQSTISSVVSGRCSYSVEKVKLLCGEVLLCLSCRRLCWLGPAFGHVFTASSVKP